MPNNDKSSDYKFTVDKQHLVSEEQHITGHAIMQIAGIAIDGTFGLYQKIKGKAMERIMNLEEEIDLSAKGIERFVSLPLEQQEGEAPSRIGVLPANDEEYLNALGLRWEVKAEASVHWLVIHDYPIPSGYNHTLSDVSLRLMPSYPDSQIDMVYFANHLTLTSNRIISRLTPANHLNRNWQQWSRHRTSQNPWRMGIDCVETHMAQVQHWLEREVK